MVMVAWILGAIFGSFLNVAGLRMPKHESVLTPRSHCPNCRHTLTAIELIPIISYMLLRGKCRVCRVPISPIYPIVELTTAFLFAFATWRIGLSWELVVALVFISLLVIVTVSDICYMLILNKVLLFFLPLLVIVRMLSPLNVWWDSVIGAAIGFFTLYLIAVLSKGGIGGGDIKLFLLIGFVLGTLHTLLTLFLAAVIGLVYGGMLLFVRKQGRKTPIPFGPAIAVAAIIVYFYGDTLLGLYVEAVWTTANKCL